MKLSRRELRPLVFPIGDVEYTVHPVGVDAGLELAKILTEGVGKPKSSSTDLFKLATGHVDPADEDSQLVWDQMRENKVPINDAFRVGMASLAHFQQLLIETGPDAWQNAERAAQAIWESGIDPKAVTAWLSAQIQPSIPAAEATTTPRRASGTGTPKTSPTRTKATRSRGPRSSASGR